MNSLTKPTCQSLANFFLTLCLCIGTTVSVCADETFIQAGKTAFAEKCADCHGRSGQGGDGHEGPLFGEETIDELAKLIERTMPEGEPEECVGEEAEAIAAFIYDDFYSVTARIEKKLPTAPRIQRMRLTVPQYRNAVADVINHFTPRPKSKRNKDPQPGIFGQYYESKQMTKTKDQKMERVDSKIVFDFGEEAPKESIDKTQFAIVWDGSIDIRDTGYYEFGVRSPNGVRLYLNLDYQPSRKGLRDDSSDHGQAALIDGWVSSSQMREHKARVFLMGGRRYPLRLEFFKFKEKRASVELTWKPPHGVWRSLDQSHLTTAVSTRTFVVDTPFPADDRSFGYERGASVSAEWQNATTQGAIAAATEVLQRLPVLAGVDDKTPDAPQKLEAFCQKFAEAAWRRPLTEGERDLFGKAFFGEGTEPRVATKRFILFALQSPHFLYADLGSSTAEVDTDAKELDQHEIATRLAFALWDSIPDERLAKDATAGKLNSDTIAKHAGRMLNDSRAHAKMHGFFHHWLELDERDRSKDQDEYPEFDEALRADLRRSLEIFLDEVVWSDESDYRQLLLADHLHLNEPLRKLYAAGEESDAKADGFARFPFEDRSGVLTHPYLLSALAYADKTSPIHRGVFLTRNIVGRGLKAPPEAVAFKDDEFADDLTMREKITQLTSSKTCMSCHSIINPLGFALENYDAIGRLRTSDADKPINTTSEYLGLNGESVEMQSASDIAQFAVANESAQRAFVAQLFKHTTKQNPYAYGGDVLDELRQEFVKGEFSIQKLWIEIATRYAMF